MSIMIALQTAIETAWVPTVRKATPIQVAIIRAEIWIMVVRVLIGLFLLFWS
jgi:hypothetical protein